MGEVWLRLLLASCKPNLSQVKFTIAKVTSAPPPLHGDTVIIYHKLYRHGRKQHNVYSLALTAPSSMTTTPSGSNIKPTNLTLSFEYVQHCEQKLPSDPHE